MRRFFFLCCFLAGMCECACCRTGVHPAVLSCFFFSSFCSAFTSVGICTVMLCYLPFFWLQRLCVCACFLGKGVEVSSQNDFSFLVCLIDAALSTVKEVRPAAMLGRQEEAAVLSLHVFCPSLRRPACGGWRENGGGRRRVKSRRDVRGRHGT